MLPYFAVAQMYAAVCSRDERPPIPKEVFVCHVYVRAYVRTCVYLCVPLLVCVQVHICRPRQHSPWCLIASYWFFPLLLYLSVLYVFIYSLFSLHTCTTFLQHPKGTHYRAILLCTFCLLQYIVFMCPCECKSRIVISILGVCMPFALFMPMLVRKHVHDVYTGAPYITTRSCSSYST